MSATNSNRGQGARVGDVSRLYCSSAIAQALSAPIVHVLYFSTNNKMYIYPCLYSMPACLKKGWGMG